MGIFASLLSGVLSLAAGIYFHFSTGKFGAMQRNCYSPLVVGLLIAAFVVVIALTLLKKHGQDYSSLGREYRNLRPDRRYYPIGEHLFFMLGDCNTQMLFSANGSRGYMAESEHLDSLRGYDNRLIGSDGRPVKVSLTSEEYNPGRFYGSDYSYRTPYGVQLRDYSALVPYLKA